MKGNNMLIKMLKDNGSYQKGQTYEIEDKKAIELLTASCCVRAKEKKEATETASVEKKVSTKKQGKADETK